MDFNVIKIMAEAVGAPEAAFRIIFSIFMVYPMSWYYRKFLSTSAPFLQNVFFSLCGVGIGVFNFGIDIYHSVLAVVCSYIALHLLGPSKANVLFNLFFHMTYLLAGYWFTGTDSYFINWTLPHCVLVLRLIGLSFDLWDGTKSMESLSVSNRLTALSEYPTFLQIFSFVFFPASFLVGPQLSMRRYLDFIQGKFNNPKGPSALMIGSKRALIGLIYLAVRQIGVIYFPDNYFLTEEFDQSSIINKHIILGVWGRIVLSQYVACWLLTEGACITFGIAYNGQDKETNLARWDGCRNIDLGIYEGLTKFYQHVVCFNINTNTWIGQYIYKRMAFLGSRQASQGIALLFLAVWHGYHSGYYILFFMEFVITNFEKEFESILNKNQTFLNISNNQIFTIISFIVMKLYVVIFMGYCLIPFSLMSFARWWKVYKSLYFSGFILFMPWSFVYKPIAKMIIKPTAVKQTSATQ